MPFEARWGKMGPQGGPLPVLVLVATVLWGASALLLFAGLPARAQEGQVQMEAVTLTSAEQDGIQAGRIVLRAIPSPGLKGRTYEAVGILEGTLEEASAIVIDYRQLSGIHAPHGANGRHRRKRCGCARRAVFKAAFGRSQALPAAIYLSKGRWRIPGRLGQGALARGPAEPVGRRHLGLLADHPLRRRPAPRGLSRLHRSGPGPAGDEGPGPLTFEARDPQGHRKGPAEARGRRSAPGMRPGARLILVTGATGYVGGRLLRLLEDRGERVRCLARRPEYLRGRARPATEVVAGDVLDPASSPPALQGVDTAYYLVHSMGSSGPFEEQDRLGAGHFGGGRPEGGPAPDHLSRRARRGHRRPVDASAEPA
ncbi:MAG: NAD(P)H-binding protein [Marinilabiliales bacterium]|nr:NAD(P)H-binding protein [Marinilabiliales bacterium]